MYAGPFQKRPVALEGRLAMIHAQRWVLVREVFSVLKQRKINDIVIFKFVGVAASDPINSVFLTMLKERRFGMGPRTALSIDKDFDLAENVNNLCSTVVRLYRARLLLFSVEL